MTTEWDDVLQKLSRDLTDRGCLIEAGFVGLREAAMSPDTPEEQVAEMRKVFMAGAQHLFANIMSILDSDREPTDADLRRMSLISDELDRFGAELRRDLNKGKH